MRFFCSFLQPKCNWNTEMNLQNLVASFRFKFFFTAEMEWKCNKTMGGVTCKISPSENYPQAKRFPVILHKGRTPSRSPDTRPCVKSHHTESERQACSTHPCLEPPTHWIGWRLIVSHPEITHTAGPSELLPLFRKEVALSTNPDEGKWMKAVVREEQHWAAQVGVARQRSEVKQRSKRTAATSSFP